MKFSTTLSEDTGEVLFGHLIFDSGKKIILDKGEVKEVENRLILAKAEGKLGRNISTGGLSFVCPDCGGMRLECVEDGPYSSEVLHIDEDGDFEWGEITANGMVERFQCLNCGTPLTDNDGNVVDDNLNVVNWIIGHSEG